MHAQNDLIVAADSRMSPVNIFLSSFVSQGNREPLDGCSIQCTIETDFVCEHVFTEKFVMNPDNTINTIGGVDSTCSLFFECGDGVVTGGTVEQCDDKNLIVGDGCDAVCKVCVLQISSSCPSHPSLMQNQS